MALLCAQFLCHWLDSLKPVKRRPSQAVESLLQLADFAIWHLQARGRLDVIFRVVRDGNGVTVKTFLAIVAVKDLECMQFDFKTAFLNASEEVAPEGVSMGRLSPAVSITFDARDRVLLLRPRSDELDCPAGPEVDERV